MEKGTASCTHSSLTWIYKVNPRLGRHNSCLSSQLVVVAGPAFLYEAHPEQSNESNSPIKSLWKSDERQRHLLIFKWCSGLKIDSQCGPHSMPATQSSQCPPRHHSPCAKAPGADGSVRNKSKYKQVAAATCQLHQLQSRRLDGSSFEPVWWATSWSRAFP